MSIDKTYQNIKYTLPEFEHSYGENVHIISDPYLLTRLADICREKTVQPKFNGVVKELYRCLFQFMVNNEFPKAEVEIPTRMSSMHPEEGIYRGEILAEDTKAVCVTLARAGVLPTQVCFDLLNRLLNPLNVRQDHVYAARMTAEDGSVTGTEFSGSKIGGDINDSFVIIADPMGATGGTIKKTIEMYKSNFGTPKAFISMNLIVTPEFIKNTLEFEPNLRIYTLRLDRGLSPSEVLQTPPGANWDQEKGLNDMDYIVPGAGGVGEVMNNSFV
jgi:uracil phosphoribosyltransferase